jgi:hypothetical protein
MQEGYIKVAQFLNKQVGGLLWALSILAVIDLAATEAKGKKQIVYSQLTLKLHINNSTEIILTMLWTILHHHNSF